MDSPSAQIESEIRHAIQSSLASRRPILHHLNADTTWLLQIPRPESAIRNGGRYYYNILIDPWLVGGQSDVASWFSQQFHATPSSVQSIAEIEELCREVEELAALNQLPEDTSTKRRSKGRRSHTTDVNGEDDPPSSLIDAVTISHEFTDHCHKDTLLTLPQTTPIFSISTAAKLITSWNHFHTVLTIPTFGSDTTDWRTTSLPPLPEYIGISRLLQKEDVLNYHAALLITFSTPSSSDDNEDAAEAILYTPHGIFSSDLQLIPSATPPIQTLAFMHGLHNVRVGTVSGATALQSNLGAHNGLKAQRVLKAKYWVGTHDEVKKGGGLVSWFLQREVISVKEALERERGEDKGDGETLASFEGVNWFDMGNGESSVLY